MKRSAESADELIFNLYAAAQDPALLPSFVSKIGEHFQAHVTGLRIHDAGHASHRYASSIGFSPLEWEVFDANCASCNVWRQRGFTDMMRDGVGHSDTIMSHSDLVKTQFYAEHAKFVEIDHGMGLCLWAHPPDQMAVISVNRSQRVGPYNASDVAYAKSLLPHFRSAYSIMRRLSWSEAERTSYESAIDRLAIGLLVCDSAGRCLYRNEAADAAVNDHAGLALTLGNKVRATDPEAQGRICDALQLAAQDRLSSPRRIYVRDLRGALRFILVVTMLRGSLGALATRGEPCVAIFIHSREQQAHAAQLRLQDAFHLTKAEARLAGQLANGDELAVCAQMLGVSMATVRTQLRGLFAKTGTSRQSALISALSFAMRVT